MTLQEVLELPRIEIEEDQGDYARVVVAPLLPGFGITLGNSLRRVLLSSLPGAAITQVLIEGVLHEFSTIPHVKEDTIEFLLNVKAIRLRALSDRPATLVLDIQGREGEITAADIQVPEHIEVVNPEQHLLTVDSPEARLHIEFTVETGRGYRPASQTDGLPIGTIAVDAIFTPVRRVSYRVEPTRVGQASNYDRLILEVWTDGTVGAVEAVSRGADMLLQHLRLFTSMGRAAAPVLSRGIGAGLLISEDQYNMPIDDLDLSMRTYNCLRRSGITTVGQVLERTEEELLSLRNFGRKSYEELRQRLAELGILPLTAETLTGATEEEEEEELAEEGELAEEAQPEAAAPAEAVQEPVAEAPPEAEMKAPTPKEEKKRERRKEKAPAETIAGGDGQEAPEAEEIDPRWAKLRELKQQAEEEE
ncbi:MAG: DNA-directed RNA polymerase subunit alpha [Dehalococcoidia bacterium]|nr:DNA-directed RNA polymerase subunit alpha [Dehalococcoidia bacterium]MDW8008258.1 DNA-directed RNA polymerase subunit alpha [Chloroflexota bacterium]